MSPQFLRTGLVLRIGSVAATISPRSVGVSVLHSDLLGWCREAMLAAVPELEGPYLKVPKVLKDNIE